MLRIFQLILLFQFSLSKVNNYEKSIAIDCNHYDDLNVNKFTRVYIDIRLSEGETVQVNEDLTHYLMTVMRLKAGHSLRIFNGKDGEFVAKLVGKLGKSCSQINIIRKTREMDGDTSEFLLPHTLYFAPIKKTRLKILVEKATELGIQRICPVITQNTNNGLDSVENIKRVIIESSEQCERLTLPLLANQLTLAELIAQHQEKVYGDLLVCREREVSSTTPLLEVLLESIWNLSGPPTGILVGPEGGWSVQELAQLSTSPAVRFVSLGPNVLRAETAAIAALSTIASMVQLSAGFRSRLMLR